MSKLYEKLSKSVNEKDVENTWRSYISKIYKSDFISPISSDGYFETGSVRCLTEFKYDEDMTSDSKGNLPIIAQCIYYFKKFQMKGEPTPNVVFVGDKNECFILPGSALTPYLDHLGYDWKLPPSSAGKNIQLLSDLQKDINISPYIFRVDQKFDFNIVKARIELASKSSKSNTPITSKNITRVFEYWVVNVLSKNHGLSDNEVVDTFLTVVCRPEEQFIHPKKTNILIVGKKEVRVNYKMYVAFFTLYKETHDPVELREITANKDRLFQEVHRRRTGAFFTPSMWVDEAHKMITEQFGEDWKEKYIVWDCSCGTLNLTRDYKFKELYCSTLDQSDLDLAILRGYNPEAVKFQFDFLNDDESKLPEGLKKALAENKPIIFFNNPPYGRANSSEDTDAIIATVQGGDAKTSMSVEMNSVKMGQAATQLYAQFLYRMMMFVRNHNLSHCNIGTFTVPSFMSGKSFERFRVRFFETFSFKDGMLFQASHFADVSDAWGISFTIFSA